MGYTWKPPTLTVPARLYQRALELEHCESVRDIVEALQEALPYIEEEVRVSTECGKVNTHPLTRFYSEMLAFLSGGGGCVDYTSLFNAMQKINERSKE